MSSIITFIYKGEVNIDQQFLPELLKAAQTLQIRGLSDSVGSKNPDSHPHSTEPLVKKRRLQSNANQNEGKDEIFSEESVIVPKQEIEDNEFIPPDIETHLSDDEDGIDVKLENSIGENSHMLVATPENHGKFIYQCLKFNANLTVV